MYLTVFLLFSFCTFCAHYIYKAVIDTGIWYVIWYAVPFSRENLETSPPPPILATSQGSVRNISLASYKIFLGGGGVVIFY